MSSEAKLVVGNPEGQITTAISVVKNEDDIAVVTISSNLSWNEVYKGITDRTVRVEPDLLIKFAEDIIKVLGGKKRE